MAYHIRKYVTAPIVKSTAKYEKINIVQKVYIVRIFTLEKYFVDYFDVSGK